MAEDNIEEAELLESLREEEESVELPKPKKKKNPNRVRAGLRLAANGQKAKEAKMKQRVLDEMYKPSTWMGVGGALASITLLSFWYLSSSQWKKIEKEEYINPPEEKPKSTNYFG